MFIPYGRHKGICLKWSSMWYVNIYVNRIKSNPYSFSFLITIQGCSVNPIIMIFKLPKYHDALYSDCMTLHRIVYELEAHRHLEQL